MNVVVGRPIELEKNPKPTPEEVYIHTHYYRMLFMLNRIYKFDPLITNFVFIPFMTFTLFRLLKYIVSLLKHFKIFLNETKLELDIRTFS
jgi:hypothetical protein